ncbi:hydrogenase formation protein HypD [Salinarchaeum sp. IM2453]|uniref:hydrogenase formation protein HypD n=1 Tax=Salinarchaeum sp. IM2453 TaxID=2862870 RepID=UPI001C830274|nr:hydrogenase formation protein HypD [Salinarchaeum sp. IM2453]QZA88545.1 hydrogenase formation protein HypD [Salinarchaeum sp. IM2453]
MTSLGDLKYRDTQKAEELADTIDEQMDSIDRDIEVMHVCGSHEQVIAKFGLRELLPSSLSVTMGPGCPVCVTNMPEVDEAVALAESGKLVATYGDMFRVPGSSKSLADAKANGASVEVVYSASDAVTLAEENPDQDVIFFATGFETTAASTAAVLQSNPPDNFYVLSAHKYVPPAMEVVAEMPSTDVDAFLAAGHAATITGYELFGSVAKRHDIPVVVGGFEPIDVLYGVQEILELVECDQVAVKNAYPRCVSKEGNKAAMQAIEQVFERTSGEWRGIANIPDANFTIRDEYHQHSARQQFETESVSDNTDMLTDQCICGDIMAGISSPDDCDLFGEECTPDNPVGACMVSDEGACKIKLEYGGLPEL